MLSFDFGKAAARPPVIEHQGVRLRAAELGDYPAWSALRRASRAHLTRWEPDWSDEEMTLDAFRLRLKSYDRQHRAGAGLALYVFEAGGDTLVGGVTLTDIRLHASQSATIGYWIGETYLRRGFGLWAVEAALRYGFGELRLNRIEAACQPGNAASRALLLKAGFVEEGFARDYLYINGAWRDHLLFARTARDYCGAPPQPKG
ncbi:MAG: GNAT family N-acetyltransferase [Parvularculaceae bacterium]|nr:GNAT family N-acetyltransferase [Parvularculaceae bacterium]